MQEEVLETTLNENNIVETEVTPIQKDIELDHSKLNNLDYEHSGHTGFQPAGNYVEDSNYTHTDNNYTTEEKTKLAGLSNYDDTALTNRISDAEEDIDTLEEMETAQNEEINDIKLLYSLKSQTGASIELSINSSTYVMTLSLKNNNGEVLSTDNIDLPLETMVVGASYDSATKEIVLTLKNGNTTRFSVADLVNGLQSEITSTNKLDSSLIDDSLSNNKFVTPTEKNAWNNKSDFSGDYNDLTNKPTIPTKTSDLTNDSDFIEGLTLLTYGVSTWADFIEAYNKNKVVYCYVSGRLAFMAYKSNSSVEFQYYRSLSSPTMSNQSDEVYVYTLQSSGWTTTTRKASTTIGAGTGIIKSYIQSSRAIILGVDTNIIATKDYVDDIVGSINTALSSLVTVGGNE